MLEVQSFSKRFFSLLEIKTHCKILTAVTVAVIKIMFIQVFHSNFALQVFHCVREQKAEDCNLIIDVNLFQQFTKSTTYTILPIYSQTTLAINFTLFVYIYVTYLSLISEGFFRPLAHRDGFVRRP